MFRGFAYLWGSWVVFGVWRNVNGYGLYSGVAKTGTVPNTVENVGVLRGQKWV